MAAPKKDSKQEAIDMLTPVSGEITDFETLLKSRNEKIDAFLIDSVEELVPVEYLESNVQGYKAEPNKRKFITEKMNNNDRREVIAEYVRITGKDPIGAKLEALCMEREDDATNDEATKNEIIENCERLFQANENKIERLKQDLAKEEERLAKKEEALDKMRTRKKKSVKLKNGHSEVEEEQDDRDSTLTALEGEVKKLQGRVTQKRNNIEKAETVQRTSKK